MDWRGVVVHVMAVVLMEFLLWLLLGFERERKKKEEEEKKGETAEIRKKKEEERKGSIGKRNG